jgi:hypothetical protein
MGLPGYRIQESAVYTTSENDNCMYRGAVIDSVLTVAPRSIATVDMRITSYDPEDDTVAPSVPQNLQLTEATPTSLGFSWDPSTDSFGVSGYRVYLDGAMVGSAADTSYTVSGLMPETSYEFQVSAYDEAENESEPSPAVPATTLATPDTVPPVLEVSDTVYGDGMGVIEVISSEPGMVYLVPEGTVSGIMEIRASSLDSAAVSSEYPLIMPINGLSNGTYWIYAADTVMNISEPASLVILGVGIRSHQLDQLRTYPNPFTTSTTLRFNLHEDQSMTLSVYDNQGHEIRRESLGPLPSGEHSLMIHREGLGQGLYLFRLQNQRGEGYSGSWIIQD